MRESNGFDPDSAGLTVCKGYQQTKKFFGLISVQTVCNGYQ